MRSGNLKIVDYPESLSRTALHGSETSPHTRNWFLSFQTWRNGCPNSWGKFKLGEGIHGEEKKQESK